ncbi:dTDP-4-dehydrorhamnose reductase [Marinimicrobium alkaliphilum]|uniref:dTDP-4-dehydrorhamnose reductase n=1 Tax=Marinimicrobium alkaliphilum TaxID=2202654 RepID=UPI000DB9DCBB|nr:dTDP-4-dehydrorhamnose reductase [Marinimicrobium alkaliphilum]
MKVVVTGGGQLAWELAQTLPASIELVRAERSLLDITDAEGCQQLLASEHPDWLINAAAYTAVDDAESDVEGAYAVNGQGAENLARACKLVGARMIQVSTDFVFDGQNSSPYLPNAWPNPQGVYGASKLAGERAVARILPEALIVRTAWLYSVQGSNFVKSMLRLMAEKPTLGVVVDQVGSPTWARGLAQMLWAGVLRKVPGGCYHWTDGGVASWYDFAVAIQDLALELGLLDKRIPIQAIASTAYPTPAVRPAFSVLDKSDTLATFELENRHWRHQLAEMLDALARS